MLVQAESGLVSITGTQETPVKTGIPTADIASGMYCAQAVLAALLRRWRTGEGATIDVSMLDATVEWMGYAMYTQMHTGVQPQRMGLSHSSIAPYDAFPTRDGQMLIGVQNDSGWRALVTQVFDVPALSDDPRFVTNVQRVRPIGLNAMRLWAQQTSRWTTAELDVRAWPPQVFLPRRSNSSIRSSIIRSCALAIGGERSQPSMPQVDALLPPVTFTDTEAPMGDVPALGQHTRALCALIEARTVGEPRPIAPSAAVSRPKPSVFNPRHLAWNQGKAPLNAYRTDCRHHRRCPRHRARDCAHLRRPRSPGSSSAISTRPRPRTPTRLHTDAIGVRCNVTDSEDIAATAERGYRRFRLARRDGQQRGHHPGRDHAQNDRAAIRRGHRRSSARLLERHPARRSDHAGQRRWVDHQHVLDLGQSRVRRTDQLLRCQGRNRGPIQGCRQRGCTPWCSSEHASQPGLIRTAMTEAMPEKAWDQKMAEIPMQRAGEPEEVASVALFYRSVLNDRHRVSRGRRLPALSRRGISVLRARRSGGIGTRRRARSWGRWSGGRWACGGPCRRSCCWQP